MAFMLSFFHMRESYQPTVEVKETEPTLTYPEKNALESFSKIFWMLGWVTAKPDAKVKPLNPKVDRPLAVRRERAKLLERFKKAGTREEKKRILQEAQQRDQALERFLQQKEVMVSRPDIGQAMARYVDMPAPPESKPKNPIVFIPGLSNDLACVDTIVQELNLRGHRVVAFGYPSASQGQVSEEFVQATKALPGFESHSRFYGSAIKEVLGNTPFELWAYSTGGPIAGEMVVNKDLPSNQVERMVLLNPASSIKQSAIQLWDGLVRELRHVVEKNFASYGLILEAKQPTTTPEDQKKKKGVFDVLLSRIREPFAKWKEMQVKQGGKIVALSCSEDDVTRSKDAFPQDLQAKNIQPVIVPGGHMAPIIDASRIVDAVEEQG